VSELSGGTAKAPALRLVHGAHESEPEWTWFCGRCAAPSPDGLPPAPYARVCGECGLGLLLETRRDVAPKTRQAFVVVDSALLVQAVSRRAERLLAVAEEDAVNRPIAELLIAADSDSARPSALGESISQTLGAGDDTTDTFARPWNTFGVRLRVRIAPCGPPRAALLVLDAPPPQSLKPVAQS
jgi:hypothetical protein